MNTPRYCNKCSMRLPIAPPENKCPSCGKPIKLFVPIQAQEGVINSSNAVN